MIGFANNDTATEIRTMWEICFGDTEQFMDLYFTHKYRNENTLIYFENGIAVASLQMLPYDIRFYGETLPFYYLAGLCTLPESRNKGYMGCLIRKAYEVMQERHIPLSILIPAEEWLYGYYGKYGFETTFKNGDQAINVKQLLDVNQSNIQRTFDDFDRKYQKNDFCVLKNLKDFECIVQDSEHEGFPTKFNLSGMSAIVDAETLLRLYAKKNINQKFTFKLYDEVFEKYTVYSIHDGSVENCFQTSEYDFEINNRVLIQLLFGFKIDLLPKRYLSHFEKHHPSMNLMLE